MSRIDDVRAKLEASLDANGKPAKGYKNRVVAIRAELVRLEAAEAARAATPTESAGTIPPGIDSDYFPP